MRTRMERIHNFGVWTQTYLESFRWLVYLLCIMLAIKEYLSLSDMSTPRGRRTKWSLSLPLHKFQPEVAPFNPNVALFGILLADSELHMSPIDCNSLHHITAASSSSLLSTRCSSSRWIPPLSSSAHHHLPHWNRTTPHCSFRLALQNWMSTALDRALCHHLLWSEGCARSHHCCS